MQSVLITLGVVGAVAGAIVGGIAKANGRSFWRWGVAGAIVGDVTVLLLVFWMLCSLSYRH